MSECCGTCKYWVLLSQHGDGACRRYPPRPFLIQTNDGYSAISHYPALSEDRWCGEYSAKLYLRDEVPHGTHGNA